MFPLKDNIPARRFPFATLLLIVANGLCFMFELGLGSHLEPFIKTFGFVPARYFALRDENIFNVGRFVPVFSSMFLHGGILHLLSNMWMLWIFGDNVEDVMGRGRFVLFYLLCGLASVVTQTLPQPTSTMPMIGASGAISGVLGAYLLLYPKARIVTLVPIFIFFTIIELPALVFLGFWFVIQLSQGYLDLLSVGARVQGGVAWWAHIGGFVAGMALVFPFRNRKLAKTKRLRRFSL